MHTVYWYVYLEQLALDPRWGKGHLVQLDLFLPPILLLVRILVVFHSLVAILVDYGAFLPLSSAVHGRDDGLEWLSGKSHHSPQLLGVVIYSDGDHCLLYQLLLRLTHQLFKL